MLDYSLSREVRETKRGQISHQAAGQLLHDHCFPLDELKISIMYMNVLKENKKNETENWAVFT